MKKVNYFDITIPFPMFNSNSEKENESKTLRFDTLPFVYNEYMFNCGQIQGDFQKER